MYSTLLPRGGGDVSKKTRGWKTGMICASRGPLGLCRKAGREQNLESRGLQESSDVSRNRVRSVRLTGDLFMLCTFDVASFQSMKYDIFMEPLQFQFYFISQHGNGKWEGGK